MNPERSRTVAYPKWGRTVFTLDRLEAGWDDPLSGAVHFAPAAWDREIPTLAVWFRGGHTELRWEPWTVRAYSGPVLPFTVTVPWGAALGTHVGLVLSAEHGFRQDLAELPLYIQPPARFQALAEILSELTGLHDCSWSAAPGGGGLRGVLRATPADRALLAELHFELFGREDLLVGGILMVRRPAPGVHGLLPALLTGGAKRVPLELDTYDLPAARAFFEGQLRAFLGPTAALPVPAAAPPPALEGLPQPASAPEPSAADLPSPARRADERG